MRISNLHLVLLGLAFWGCGESQASEDGGASSTSDAGTRDVSDASGEEDTTVIEDGSVVDVASDVADATSAEDAALTDALSPVPDAPPARPQRIMCIGDSISEGSNTGNTYRSHLYFDLVAASLSFDFVGSNRGTCGNINAGTSDGWDADHNGFYSATSAQILDGNMPVNDCSPAGAGNIRDWAPTYRADIAIIHLGTNDCRGGASSAQIQGRLGGIIAELRAAVPDVKVAVAQIIASRDSALNRCVTSLNADLPSWGATISTDFSPVVIVDQQTGWDSDTHQRDTFHPNAAGAGRMAESFLPVVVSFFE
ncbi:MAG: acyl-CoA thioesterase-1 [Polyangiales bacterium]|jgi:acyl-CoA thioesterase-1